MLETTSTLTPWQLLRQPAFRLLWLGQSTALLGDALFALALIWLVLQLTDSGLIMGTVLMVGAVPRAVFMLVGGAVSDRVAPHAVLRLSTIATAIIVLLVTAILATSGLALWALYAVAGLYGLVDAFSYPASMATVPRVVARQQLMLANTLMQGAEAAVTLVAAALIGPLLTLLGLTGTFAIIAGLLLSASALLWRVRLAPASGEPTATAPAATATAADWGIGRDILAGLRYVWREPALRVSLFLVAMLNLAVSGPLSVGGALLVERRFGADAGAFGTLLTSAAVGSLLGMGIAGSLGSGHHLGRLLALLAGGLGLALIALGGVGDLWLASAIMGGIGLAASVVGILATSWLQTHVAPAMLGRTMSLLLLAAVALDPLSQALTGLLADIDLTLVFVVAGLALIVTSGLAGLSRAVRQGVVPGAADAGD